MLAKGFTLIELILVIVLVGVLTAFALPKFANLSDDAERASAASMTKAFEAGINLAHYKWLTSGEPSSITINGQTIHMTTEGWPQPSPLGQAGCQNLWNQLLQTPPPLSLYLFSTPSEEWSVLGSHVSCLFLYEAGTSADANFTPLFSYHPAAWPASSPSPQFKAGEVRGQNLD